MEKHHKRAMKEIAGAKKKLAAAEKKIKTYITKNPMKAVAIAAGIGAAIAGIAAGTAYMVKKKRK